MLLKPCNHCRRRGQCETHAAKLKALRGSGITVAQFKCPTLKADFVPGMRVQARIEGITFEDGPHGKYRGAADFAGTVMRWCGHKVLVCIDPDQDDETHRAVVKIRPDRLEATGEIMAVCGACGLPVGRKLDEWDCWVCHRENAAGGA